MAQKKTFIFMLLLSIGIPSVIQASCQTSCNTSLNCDDTLCSCPCSGKTYFSNRPLFQSYRGEFIAGFRNDLMELGYEQNGWGGALDIVPFGGQSSDGFGLASYFLPFCKNPLTVNEELQSPTQSNFADLYSPNFNVLTIGGSTTPGANTPFASTVKFCARHDEYGVGFHWKQGFGFCETDCGKKWWYIDIALPVTQVRNLICIDEQIQSTGGGVNTDIATGGSPNAVPNMVQAFAQNAWNFGKIISGCFLKKTGVADIELKFARQWLWTEECNMASYIGVLIPTGNAPCGQFVFEPIVGHGKHAGIIWGGEGTMDMWADNTHDKYVSIGVAAQMQYLFNRKQIRSFDVKNRPWSRYIPVYANLEQATLASTSADPSLNTPGINVFTQCVNVIPGLQLNATTALILQADNGFQGELGYNFYGHHQECVSLATPWAVGPAFIAAGPNFGLVPPGTTNPYRTITPDGNLNGSDFNNPLVDYNDSLIKATDLDLQSAAHPYYFSHTVHINLGRNWNEQCVPTYLGVGGSYEFALHEFAVMKRWTVWGKFNISF